MQKGGSDTHALAVAAEKQAASSEALSRNASGQVNALRELVFATTKSAKAAVLQSQTSANQLQSSERPWITVEANVASDLVYSSGVADIAIRFVVTNIGHSPAINVSTFPELSPMPITTEHLRETCRVDKENFRPGAASIDSVFPTHSEEITLGLRLGPRIIVPPVMRGRMIPSLAGCVTYGTSFDNQAHQTGFLYDIGQRVDPAEPRNHSIPINVDVPRTNLSLDRMTPPFGRFVN